jgi:hypothetical protein
VTTPAPRPDVPAIRQALDLLHPAGEAVVIELRAIFTQPRKRIDAGYFDSEHRDEAAREAARLNLAGGNVYLQLNPCDPQLLSRARNRVQQGAADTLTDANILRRRWLLIDIDPRRPKGTAATDAQVEAAKAAGRALYAHLRSQAWPEPMIAESGNGIHLLYRVDLPNDAQSRDTVKAALAALARRFDTDAVSVDQSVFNAGRIVKLWGTVSTKGDHCDEAPHRLSHVVSTHVASAPPVSIEALQALAAEVAPAPTPAPAARPAARPAQGSAPPFDLSEFMRRLGAATGITWTESTHEGSTRYQLSECPFNADHKLGEAAIFQRGNGALGFKCQHASCAGYRWANVRELIDGRREQRQPAAQAPGRRAAAPAPATPASAAPATAEPVEPDACEWPAPLPAELSSDDAAPPPYPVEAWPRELVPLLDELNEVTQAPAAMIGGSVLASMATCTQHLCNVEVDALRRYPLSLYTLTVAEPNERKSSVTDLAFRGCREWEAEHREADRQAFGRYRAELRQWEQQAAAAQARLTSRKGERPLDATEAAQALDELAQVETRKPEPPRVASLLHENATIEALKHALATERPAACLLSDEASLVWRGPSMQGAAVTGTVSDLAGLWTGKAIRNRRRKEGGTYHCQAPRLSMGHMIQPGSLQTVWRDVGRESEEGGLIGRFLIAEPPTRQGSRQYIPPGAVPLTDTHAMRCRELLSIPIVYSSAGAMRLGALPLSSEARHDWAAFLNDVEAQVGPGGAYAVIRDAAGKAAEQAARIAAVWHVYLHGPVGEVSAALLAGAIALMRWHLGEFGRVVGALGDVSGIPAAIKLDRWLIERARVTGGGVLWRECQRCGPRATREAEALNAALEYLGSRGRVRVVSIKLDRGGCAQRFVEVNPALLIEGGNHG